MQGSQRQPLDREAWIGRARVASFIGFIGLIAIAASRFLGGGDDPSYASKSLKAVSVTVEGPSSSIRIIAPRAYLVEQVNDGATLRGEIGVPALTLSAAWSLAPCRRTPGCDAGGPGALRIGIPYPYDFVNDLDDVQEPGRGAIDKLTDLPGFSLRRTPGAAGGEAGPFRTEVRQYEPWGESRVRRVRCNLLVGPDVKVGDCEAVVAWREGWLIQVVVPVADLQRIEEAGEGAATLLDQLRAPTAPRS